jgi:hypothetical protein
MTDDDYELTRHARVYQLSMYWGLSEKLRNIPLENFRIAIQRGWELEELLLTLSTMLHPIFPGFSEDLSYAKICEDRIVKLILRTLRTNIEGCDGRFLELYLQSSPFHRMIKKSLAKSG